MAGTLLNSEKHVSENTRAAKELSDVVVADNDHDGCAQGIEEYLLK